MNTILKSVPDLKISLAAKEWTFKSPFLFTQERLCLPHHILEERGLVKVGVTVQALLELPTTKASQLSMA